MTLFQRARKLAKETGRTIFIYTDGSLRLREDRDAKWQGECGIAWSDGSSMACLSDG